METFQNELEKITYVKTFKELKLRYDQSKEKLNDSLSLSKRLSNESTPALYRTKAPSDRFRDFDKDNEDAWIEEDDTDELENKIEPNTSNHTNNSFNDDNDNQLETFLEFKKNSGKCLFRIYGYVSLIIAKFKLLYAIKRVSCLGFMT